ncbi:ammonium transporter AmtB-like domain-containing protein [Baffinella frigidus]|nr:ammonium transporter AmtB-like domain-containing protein [Cryptophyta sp. CCMP2293]
MSMGSSMGHREEAPAAVHAAQRRSSIVGAAGAGCGAEVASVRASVRVQSRGSGWGSALVLSAALVGLGAVAGEGAPALRGLKPVPSDSIGRTGVAAAQHQLQFEPGSSSGHQGEMRLRSMETDLEARMVALENKVTKAKNAADESWILMSSTLVLMMTISGLALFYGGLVRVQNVLATVMQSFAIACLITVLWIAVGYSLCFTEGSVVYGSYQRGASFTS